MRRLIHVKIAFFGIGKWLARRNGIFLILCRVEAASHDPGGASHGLWPGDPVQIQGPLTAQPWAYFYFRAVRFILRIPHAPLSESHDMINRHRRLRAETSGHEIYRGPPHREPLPCMQLPASGPIRVFRVFRGSSSLTQDPSPMRSANDELADQPLGRIPRLCVLATQTRCL